MITIRPAAVPDAPAVLRMGSAFVAAHLPDVPVDAGAMAGTVAYLLGDPATRAVLLAEDAEGVPHGMIGLAIVPHHLTGRLTTHELFWWVDPHTRVTGAGIALLAAGEQWARTHGAATLHMVALAGVTPHLSRLYTRRGYTQRETVFEKVL